MTREKDVLHIFYLNKPAADGFWSLRVMELRILFLFTHINMRPYCDWGSDNFGQFLLSVMIYVIHSYICDIIIVIAHSLTRC